MAALLALLSLSVKPHHRQKLMASNAVGLVMKALERHEGHPAIEVRRPGWGTQPFPPSAFLASFPRSPFALLASAVFSAPAAAAAAAHSVRNLNAPKPPTPSPPSPNAALASAIRLLDLREPGAGRHEPRPAGARGRPGAPQPPDSLPPGAPLRGLGRHCQTRLWHFATASAGWQRAGSVGAGGLRRKHAPVCPLIAAPTGQVFVYSRFEAILCLPAIMCPPRSRK